MISSGIRVLKRIKLRTTLAPLTSLNSFFRVLGVARYLHANGNMQLPLKPPESFSHCTSIGFRPVVEVWYCMKSYTIYRNQHKKRWCETGVKHFSTNQRLHAVPEKVLDSLPLGACELCRQRHQLPTFIINDSLLGYGIKDQRLTFLPPIGPLRQLATPGLGASSTLPLQFIGNIGARAQYITIHQYNSISIPKLHWLHIVTPVSPSLEVEVEVEELSPVVGPETKKRLHVNFESYIKSSPCGCCQ